VLPRLHRFKDMGGWVAAFADDGTVTHQSIGGTWHAPDELPEYRRASQPCVRADR